MFFIKWSLEMEAFDVPIALSDFEVVRSWPRFTLIYPHSHPLAQLINIDMRLRLVVLSEEDYYSLLQKELDLDNVKPEGAKYYDLAYLRECMALGVTDKEWALCYGPDNLKEFCYKAKAEPTGYVKVISLLAPKYSLRELNIQIGRDLKKGR